MQHAYLVSLLLLLTLAGGPRAARGQSVGIGTSSPAPSAALDVSATGKGLLPPRLTQAQRDGIGSPAAGLLIFNTTTSALNQWSGTAWTVLLAAEPVLVAGAPVSYTTLGTATYAVPSGVYTLDAVVQASAGGGSPGGRGARVTARLAVTPGEVLTVVVGGASRLRRAVGVGATGDVQTSRNALVVAGAGGWRGQSLNSYGGGIGGNGGTPNGANGGVSSASPSGGGGGGATQSGNGAPGAANGSGNQGGPGGAGYFDGGPGGPGAQAGGGGGGGSSWVTAVGSTNVSYALAGSPADAPFVTLTPYTEVLAPAFSAANLTNISEAQALTYDGPTQALTLSGGNSAASTVTLTEHQQLSLSGTTMSISGAGGNAVALPPADNLGNHTATQALNLPGSTVVEFGQGVSGKEANAGKIGYQTFTTGALDVVGAGTTGTNRKIKLWAEGGLSVQGLHGTGTRVVTADASGALSTSATATTNLDMLLRMQRGTFTIGTSGTASKVVTVTFPTSFGSAPGQVICTVRTETGQTYTDVFSVTTKEITATGFKANILRVDSAAAWGQTLLLDWLALP